MKKLLIIALLIVGCDDCYLRQIRGIDCDCSDGNVRDDCGYCTGPTSGYKWNEAQDCSGECGGNAIEDCIGICRGEANWQNGWTDNFGFCCPHDTLDDGSIIPMCNQ